MRSHLTDDLADMKVHKRSTLLTSAMRLYPIYIALILTACGGGGSGFSSSGSTSAQNIALVSGNSQKVPRYTSLAPLVVVVTDINGSPVTNAQVTWSVTTGDGSLNSTTTLTNSSGTTSNTYTSAQSLLGFTVVASLVGTQQSVSFTNTPNIPFQYQWYPSSSTSSGYTFTGGAVNCGSSFCQLSSTSHSDSVSSGLSSATYNGALLDSSNSVELVRLSGQSTAAELDASWAPAPAGSSQDNSVPSSYLDAYWKLDEASGASSFADSSGHSLALTNSCTGSPPSAGVTGQLGNAVSFAGNNCIHTSSGPSILGTSQLSVSAWVNVSSFGSFNRIVSEGNGSSENAFDLELSSTHTGSFYVSTTSARAGVDPGKSQMLAGQWYFMVGVYDGSKIHFYLNGSEQGTATSQTGTIVSTSNDISLSIGGKSTTGQFNGLIDEVAVWNTALSATQIQNIYARQSAKYTGVVTSRVFDAGGATAWGAFSWTTTIPFLKELTDMQNSETSSSYQSVYVNPPANGLSSGLMSGNIALFHFDNPSIYPMDNSGLGNVVTVSGLASIKGVFGPAAYFNGTSSSIQSTNYNLSSMDGTISLWVNPSLASGDGTIFQASNSASILLEQTANSELGFTLGSTTGNFTLSTLPPNTWSHVVLTWNSGTYYIYQNGQVQTGSYSGLNSVGNCAVVGASSNCAAIPSLSNYFQGGVDELSVWNRALSSNEVMQLYRRGANRIKFQVQTCGTAASCGTQSNWQGPHGTNQTYFSELNNNLTPADAGDLSSSDQTVAALPSFPLSNFTAMSLGSANEFFQYRFIMESDDSGSGAVPCSYDGGGSGSCSPELTAVSANSNYPTTAGVMISPALPYNYYALNLFQESYGALGCSAGTVYNISTDGNTWYYWNGNTWSVAGGTNITASSAAQVNAHIANFSANIGGAIPSFYFKVFLQSTNGSPCQLSRVNVGGISDPSLVSYNQVFYDDFNTLNIAPYSVSNPQGFDGSGYNWYGGVWYENMPSVSQTWSVANSALSLVWNSGQSLSDTSISTFSTNGLNYQAWTYGYYEAKMKWNPVLGSWPVFWLIPIEGFSKQTYNGIRYSGEFDVFEGQGGNPGNYYGTVHYWADVSSGSSRVSQDTWNNGGANAYPAVINGSSVDYTQYHLYGLLWQPGANNTPGRLTWYLDHQPLNTITLPSTVFDQQHYYLILGSQLGVFGSNYGQSLTQFQSANPGLNSLTSTWDWVRVWHP